MFVGWWYCPWKWQETRLVVSSSCGVPVPFGACTLLPILPEVFPSFIQCFAVGVSIWLSQLLCGVPERTAFHDFCLQAWESIINTFRNWCLSLGMILSWAHYWLAIPSVSAPSHVPAFLVDRIRFGSKVLWVVWCPYHSNRDPAQLQEITSSGFISLVLWLTAKVILIDYWSALFCRSLSRPGDAPYIPQFPFPSPLQPSSLPFSDSHDYFIHPSKWD